MCIKVGWFEGECFSLEMLGLERSFKIFIYSFICFLVIAMGGWMGGYDDRLRIAIRF